MCEWCTKGIPAVTAVFMLILTLLITPTFVIAADEKNDSKTKPNAKNKKPTSTVSASKVAKDPDGALRKTTPAEERKLNEELQKTLAKYPKRAAKKKADGSTSLVIAPHAISVSTAHREPDGTIKLNCSQHHEKSGKIPVKTAKSNTEELPEE
jgi:hypothetical protein